MNRIQKYTPEFDQFDMVFGGSLKADNRWIILAGLIPWQAVEEKYSKLFVAECKDLKGQIESYKRRYGKYPEVVCADKIYRTWENRRYCQEYGIRLSGPKLERPFKDNGKNKRKIREQKRIEREDENSRIAVNGKFGEVKRRYTLDKIRTKLKETSATSIMMVFLVMNHVVLARRNAKAFFMSLIDMIIEMAERLNFVSMKQFGAA